MSAFRLESGGRIDRARTLRFSFDGKDYQGFAGDTLASALLANGVRCCARSFKYHRPRGIWGYGPEEPNALMQVGPIPNLRATEIELEDGLSARAVNCWPNAGFDLGAVNNLLAPFLPAGFYYKTFIWPNWRVFEWAIRRAAGLGRASLEPDQDVYDQCFAHCDVLVVGSGPAGLAAARAAASSGARVILCEQDREIGGQLLAAPARIDGVASDDWIAATLRDLEDRPDVRVLTRTTAAGYFDHNAIALFEKRRGGGRLWQIRAGRVVLCTGATERPLVFPGNDRPGVMSSLAIRHYIRRYAVRPGRQAVLFTNNDPGYGVLDDLAAAGIEVSAVVDARKGAAIIGTSQGGVTIRTEEGQRVERPADLVAVSGGWNPNVHLFSQSGGKLAFDSRQLLFRPDRSVQKEYSAGAANGVFGLTEALRDGHDAGRRAAQDAGFPAIMPMPETDTPTTPLNIGACWEVAGRQKAFVDFQNDVTSDDIALAAAENFISVEHLKRYTTLGMGTDQGKTSNVNALAIMGQATGRDPQAVGTTTFRFPYTPIALGALRGQAKGDLFRPKRHLASHDWHAANGAVFEDYGQWQRPAYYRRNGESPHDVEQREARAVRERAGIFDASPLGKIVVRGPDAAEFLDRVYANTMSTLKPGRIRYGLMLNELGALIDDGVVARFDADHFLLSTTSSGAERIAAWLEEWLQCEWVELDVTVTPVTTAWAAIALAGPKARTILERAGTDFPIGPQDLPHMAFHTGTVAGISARIFRVSFSGEVSFEINIPTSRCDQLWQALIAAGAEDGLMPVGIDAWMVLRTEKGYLHIGSDTDGTTLPDDVGWGHVLKRQRDFIGRRSLLLPEGRRDDRHQLVGLEALDRNLVLSIGAHLEGGAGYVTSSSFSPALGRGVALGMVRRGRALLGQTVTILDKGRRVAVKVAPLCAYDPEGARLNG